jgi:hypothetical protein
MASDGAHRLHLDVLLPQSLSAAVGVNLFSLDHNQCLTPSLQTDLSECETLDSVEDSSDA